MNKISYAKITSHFYNLGMQAAYNTGRHKTAASAKDIAKMLGRGSAYTLPTVGTVGGAGIGASTGFDLGQLVAGAPLREALLKIQNSNQPHEIIKAIGDAPLLLGLAGAGIGAGTALGGIGGGILGNKGGNLLKDKLLRKLSQ